jgi:hypothetical protein
MSLSKSKEGVIAPHSYQLAGIILCSPLANNNALI